MPDWIKRADGLFVGQAANFSRIIRSDPEAYGTTALVADELAERQAAFAEAWRVTWQVTGNSSSAVHEKNRLRKELASLMRSLRGTIDAMSSVSEIQKYLLGMGTPAAAVTAQLAAVTDLVVCVSDF